MYLFTNIKDDIPLVITTTLQVKEKIIQCNKYKFTKKLDCSLAIRRETWWNLSSSLLSRKLQPSCCLDPTISLILEVGVRSEVLIYGTTLNPLINIDQISPWNISVIWNKVATWIKGMIINNKRQAVRRQDCLREDVSYFLCCATSKIGDVSTQAKDKIAHILFSKLVDKGKMNFLTIL